MDSGRVKELKSKARGLEPVVRIGKNGLTESTVEQVRKVLLKRKLVKIKLLRSFVESNDRRSAARDLSERTGAELIEQVGFTVVLYKR